MKILIAWLLILMGCSSKGEGSQDRILKLQSVWNTRDIRVAVENIKGLRIVAEDAEYEVYGIEDKIKIFSFSITVQKKNRKIVSIVAPVGNGEEVSSDFVKEKLKSDDWKTYEHPKKGIDYIQLDVTEYSEKLGVGFAYDKLDKKKKTRMIYWGVDPRNIQQIL
jgi:hypothetical protein